MSRFPSEVFRARVTRKQTLSRDFVRISLASEELAGLAAPAGTGEGPVLDAYFKLLVPHPEAEGPVEPDLDSDWHREWFGAAPEERGGWLRTYTFRAVRPWSEGERKGVEIDVDFVLHAEDAPEGPAETAPASPEEDAPSFEAALASGMGPGAAWAASARPGDEIGFIGPSREGRLWTSWAPGSADRVVLAVDETAVPAAGSVLAHLPSGCRADVVLEVPEGNRALEECLREELETARSRAEAGVHWLHRAPGADRGAALLGTLREVLGASGGSRTADPVPSEEPEDLVWGTAEGERRTYAYLAGEASVVRAARRVCVQEAGLDKADVTFMGYWRQGRSEG